jgi:hypothetical protein
VRAWDELLGLEMQVGQRAWIGMRAGREARRVERRPGRDAIGPAGDLREQDAAPTASATHFLVKLSWRRRPCTRRRPLRNARRRRPRIPHERVLGRAASFFSAAAAVQLGSARAIRRQATGDDQVFIIDIRGMVTLA